jgi:hypothetical protein
MILADLAHARSGDKTGSVNIGILVVDRENVPLVERALTPEKVRQTLGMPETQRVEIYRLPQLGAFNIVLPDALGGAPSYSLSFDVFGHYFGSRILALKVGNE